MKKSVGDRLMKFCDILSLWWVRIVKKITKNGASNGAKCC